MGVVARLILPVVPIQKIPRPLQEVHLREVQVPRGVQVEVLQGQGLLWQSLTMGTVSVLIVIRTRILFGTQVIGARTLVTTPALTITKPTPMTRSIMVVS